MSDLRWQSLHEWEPAEGTWALLWPGYYGPFTACWMRGRWTMCEDADFDHATIGAEIEIPHLATDAIPEFDRLAVGAAFGSAAHEAAPDPDTAPHAMLRAMLIGIVDPASPELDYLRACNSVRATSGDGSDDKAHYVKQPGASE